MAVMAVTKGWNVSIMINAFLCQFQKQAKEIEGAKHTIYGETESK